MIFQYVSDIHLEFHDKHNEGKIQPDMFVKPGAAPYLALVGDIGIPELASMSVFLEWCSKHWTHVFWVPGNHEYYNYRNPTPNTVSTKDTLMKDMVARWSNVHLLNRSTYDIDNVRFAGCTLWSHIPIEKDKLAILDMNDSKQIKITDTRAALPQDFREWHERDRRWVEEEIQRAEKDAKDLVILTHYLPSYRLIHPKYEGHPLNFCFATSLDAMIRSPVRAWICGHSHMSVDTVINGVPCSLNPFGYPQENTKHSINRSKVMKIGEAVPVSSSKEEEVAYDFV